MIRRYWFVWLAMACSQAAQIACAIEPGEVESIEVEPRGQRLTGPAALHGLLVAARLADGRIFDVTREASYVSSNPAVARVSKWGVVEAVADGSVEIEVRFGVQIQTVQAIVADTGLPRSYHFENDVIPVLNKFGCNASGCHGKAEGQNGFKLSIFGSDPLADFEAMSKEGRGRRVLSAVPDRSLVLQKASGGLPHGGGIRIPRGSREYDILLGWIAAGMPIGDADAARVVKIKLSPGERRLDMGASQQLRVLAFYSDGRQIDVTGMAKYQSNNEGLARVDESGWVEVGKSPGQVAIMASYQGAVDTFRALIPRTETIADYPQLAENNFIDRLVHAKLRKLNIIPTGVADDAEFMRRVYLDIIGTLPTPVEARQFLADQTADKRQRLVERLLDRPEYADFWAQRWADLLRVDRQKLGRKGAYAYYRSIREAFAGNVPFDQFARGFILAEGTLDQAPQAYFRVVAGSPGDAASSLSQVFLGVRIACAQCHHHPFDRWSEDDYYGMTAFFQPLVFKGTSRGTMTAVTGLAAAKNPRSGKDVPAHPLGVSAPEQLPAGDARLQLADWLTSPSNPWFSRNLVNRVWAHFLGRGLVEPVDDLRETNPPTNPELLDALARHLVEQQFDLKRLILAITTSQTYQRASRPNATNELDEQNYSRALLRRIDAEVLLDGVCQVTGVAEKFDGAPVVTRAIGLWDSEIDHYFLKLFGRPTRKTACNCERQVEPTVGQVLHVLNSPEIHAKLGHESGRIRRLADTMGDDSLLADELYLTFFARYPADDERRTVLEVLARSSTNRHAAVEDLAWSLMNTLEFIFNH